MRNNRIIRAWAIAGISGLAAIGLAPTDAGAVSCGTVGSLDTTHVQLTSTSPDLGGTYPIVSDACAGTFPGNETGGNGAGLLTELNDNNVFGGYTDNDWVYLGESDSDLISFTPTGDGVGTFELDFFPDEYDVFALSLFGGNSWGVWLFDLASAITNADGAYSMAGILNPGGQIPDLSHIGVAAYSSATTTVIPIPAPLTLFLTGLVGIGLLARRRRQMAEV